MAAIISSCVTASRLTPLGNYWRKAIRVFAQGCYQGAVSAQPRTMSLPRLVFPLQARVSRLLASAFLLQYPRNPVFTSFTAFSVENVTVFCNISTYFRLLVVFKGRRLKSLQTMQSLLRPPRPCGPQRQGEAA